VRKSCECVVGDTSDGVCCERRGALDGARGRGSVPAMLRFKADRRTLAFVATYYGLVIFQWFFAPKDLVFAVPLVLLTMALSWICAVITHNTIHAPVFKSRLLNKGFQVALTCAYGFPVSEYVPGHNLSHHKHTQMPKDVMRTTKVDTGSNLLNFILFVPRVAFDVTGGNMRFVKTMKRTHPEVVPAVLDRGVLRVGREGDLARDRLAQDAALHRPAALVRGVGHHGGELPAARRLRHHAPGEPLAQLRGRAVQLVHVQQRVSRDAPRATGAALVAVAREALREAAPDHRPRGSSRSPCWSISSTRSSTPASAARSTESPWWSK
jgi:hypothetical protein